MGRACRAPAALTLNQLAAVYKHSGGCGRAFGRSWRPTRLDGCVEGTTSTPARLRAGAGEVGWGLGMVQERCDGGSKRRSIRADSAPDPSDVQLDVVVNERITHAGDLSPRDRWMGIADLAAEIRRGCTDHLQVADHAVLDQV